DLTIIQDERVYIFEFKVRERVKERISAINRIKEMGYAEKYKGRYREINLIGIEFSEKRRNIVKSEVIKLRSRTSKGKK
ncbi:MAG: PD-(D/E)XK nuclease domain-containing protein, partial [Myxococcota bacterium]